VGGLGALKGPLFWCSDQWCKVLRLAQFGWTDPGLVRPVRQLEGPCTSQGLLRLDPTSFPRRVLLPSDGSISSSIGSNQTNDGSFDRFRRLLSSHALMQNELCKTCFLEAKHHHQMVVTPNDPSV